MRSQRVSDRRMSLAEFEAMPEDDLYRYEVVHGWLVCEPRLAPLHGLVTTRLVHALEQHMSVSNAGLVLTEVAFVFREEPLLLRVPDIAFVAIGRVPQPAYDVGFWRLAPDLAVEVLSPSNSRAEIGEKVREYLGAGSRAVWVVDPRACKVTVHDVQHSVVVTGAATLAAAPVLPGLRISLPDLFRR